MIKLQGARGQRGVGFGQLSVERHRAECCGFGQAQRLGPRDITVCRKQAIRIRQARIRLGKIGIGYRSGFEGFNRVPDATLRPQVPFVAAAEVQRVRVAPLRGPLTERPAGGSGQLQS
jgi:hypothetical protein